MAMDHVDDTAGDSGADGATGVGAAHGAGSSGDLERELASVVGGLRTHLEWLLGLGVSHAPAGPTPRSSPPSADGVETSGDTQAGDAVMGSGNTLSLLDNPGPGREGLAAVRGLLGDCQRCRLSRDRVQIVFGQGNPTADLMFVGEGPGRDEDLQGKAFVGAAGRLLTKMIQAMGHHREDVFIANVVKCRPPRNRNPEPDEMASCEPFLLAQIRAIRPTVIVTLGRFAAQTLLQTDQSIGRLRGRLHTFHLDGDQVALCPTYHPAYLLRNPGAKRAVWEDLQLVMALLDRPASGR